MAIYEYRCPRCKAEFEVMRSMKDASATAECPRCHASANRLPSLFGSTPAGGYGIKVPEKGPFRGRKR